MRPDHWAIAFNGWIRIQNDGSYAFWLSSDDGSRLIVDGKRIAVNDGVHGMMEKRGDVFLTQGMHAVRVEFFDYDQGEDLWLEYSGPGITRREVPRGILFTGK